MWPLKIQGADVVVRGEDHDGLHVLVTNALCMGALWPGLAYYQGQWYEWSTNGTIEIEDAGSVFGHGIYRPLGTFVFIDADWREVLDLKEDQ